MTPKIVEVAHVRDYILRVRFRDGLEGEIDLGAELHGEVFEPLKDPDLFRAAFAHPELETIVWPNGADLSPEFLYARVSESLRSATPN